MKVNTRCIPTCEGYQNAEKQVGQLRLSSSSSSSSPNPEDEEKMEVVEDDVVEVLEVVVHT